MGNAPSRTIRIENLKEGDVEALGQPGGRIFAIPDIHGMFHLLKLVMDFLYETAKLDLTKDKLVFLGDMIERGPDSDKVLEYIMRLQMDNPDSVIVLRGNHEDLCLEAFRTGSYSDFQLWLENGGKDTLRSFKSGGAGVPDHILAWMGKLPYKHEEPGFFFSHAPVRREHRRGVNEGKPFTVEELTWGRGEDEKGYAREFGKVEGEAPAVGVCGHNHGFKTYPRLYDHYIYADAGAGCMPKAPLVCIEVRSRVCIEARAEPLPEKTGKERREGAHLCLNCWGRGADRFCLRCTDGYYCDECFEKHGQKCKEADLTDPA